MNQVIQAVTFSSPIVGGHLTICKGHLTIPKRSPAELLGIFFIQFLYTSSCGLVSSSNSEARPFLDSFLKLVEALEAVTGGNDWRLAFLINTYKYK